MRGTIIKLRDTDQILISLNLYENKRVFSPSFLYLLSLAELNIVKQIVYSWEKKNKHKFQILVDPISYPT